LRAAWPPAAWQLDISPLRPVSCQFSFARQQAPKCTSVCKWAYPPRTMASVPADAPVWHLYVPKLVTILRHGYGLRDFRHDLVAGATVAVVALPLAMALAIASGTTPEKGLQTAVVAGFLISALGGSRVQIGGPTAAFIPVVFNVIEHFGYGGMLL